MSRRKQRRKTGRKPRVSSPVHLNTQAITISRVARLSAEDAAGQRTLVQAHLAKFLMGDDCATRWRILADTANMAETLAGMGLGSGPDADQIIAAGQAALAAVWQRAHQAGPRRGSWTLYADEIDALRWLVALHCDTQLPACSYGELETALRRTQMRIAQARAGNASPGTVVLAGNFETTTTNEVHAS